MDIDAIAERLVSERQKLGLRAVDVYTQTDMHQNTYRNYEIGKRDMPASLLVKLWNIGFDVMYILTGQRLEDIALDVKASGGVPSYHQRLITLPEIMDIENPADLLLTAMYHAEEALIQAGAEANSDYSYKDLATIGMGMMDKVK